MTKNGQKMGQKWSFGLFRKIYLLKNLKNLVLKLWLKMLSVNQISLFFNCQYLINGLTSDSDFLHIDKHE